MYICANPVSSSNGRSPAKPGRDLTFHWEAAKPENADRRSTLNQKQLTHLSEVDAIHCITDEIKIGQVKLE